MTQNKFGFDANSVAKDAYSRGHEELSAEKCAEWVWGIIYLTWLA